jgi:hypothetical protein
LRARGGHIGMMLRLPASRVAMKSLSWGSNSPVDYPWIWLFFVAASDPRMSQIYKNSGYILGTIIPTDFDIFQWGRYTSNQTINSNYTLEKTRPGIPWVN